MVDVRALLDPLGGNIVMAELNRLMEQQRRHDKHDGTVRTAGQRRADALVEMATRSRSAQPGGLRPRPLITILTGEASFARICELADGTVVTPGQIVPLLSEADIERIVFDGPDRVISVSRRRTFTGALRRAIEVARPALPTPLRMRRTRRPLRRRPHPALHPRRPNHPRQWTTRAAGRTTAIKTSATPTHQNQTTRPDDRAPPGAV